MSDNLSGCNCCISNCACFVDWLIPYGIFSSGETLTGTATTINPETYTVTDIGPTIAGTLESVIALLENLTPFSDTAIELSDTILARINELNPIGINFSTYSSYLTSASNNVLSIASKFNLLNVSRTDLLSLCSSYLDDYDDWIIAHSTLYLFSANTSANSLVSKTAAILQIAQLISALWVAVEANIVSMKTLALPPDGNSLDIRSASNIFKQYIGAASGITASFDSAKVITNTMTVTPFTDAVKTLKEDVVHFREGTYGILTRIKAVNTGEPLSTTFTESLVLLEDLNPFSDTSSQLSDFILGLKPNLSPPSVPLNTELTDASSLTLTKSGLTSAFQTRLNDLIADVEGIIDDWDTWYDDFYDRYTLTSVQTEQLFTKVSEFQDELNSLVPAWTNLQSKIDKLKSTTIPPNTNVAVVTTRVADYVADVDELDLRLTAVETKLGLITLTPFTSLDKTLVDWTGLLINDEYTTVVMEQVADLPDDGNTELDNKISTSINHNNWPTIHHQNRNAFWISQKVVNVPIKNVAMEDGITLGDLYLRNIGIIVRRDLEVFYSAPISAFAQTLFDASEYSTTLWDHQHYSTHSYVIGNEPSVEFPTLSITLPTEDSDVEWEVVSCLMNCPTRTQHPIENLTHRRWRSSNAFWSREVDTDTYEYTINYTVTGIATLQGPPLGGGKFNTNCYVIDYTNFSTVTVSGMFGYNQSGARFVSKSGNITEIPYTSEELNILLNGPLDEHWYWENPFNANITTSFQYDGIRDLLIPSFKWIPTYTSYVETIHDVVVNTSNIPPHEIPQRADYDALNSFDRTRTQTVQFHAGAPFLFATAHYCNPINNLQNSNAMLNVAYNGIPLLYTGVAPKPLSTSTTETLNTCPEYERTYQSTGNSGICGLQVADIYEYRSGLVIQQTTEYDWTRDVVPL